MTDADQAGQTWQPDYTCTCGAVYSHQDATPHTSECRGGIYGVHEQAVTHLRALESTITRQRAALTTAKEALVLMSYTADFGNGPELCWCRDGFHDGDPSDDEPDFHASYCQLARAALAQITAIEGKAG